jgi:hypothetical protein
MAKPDTIVIDGHGYNWQKICELRRQQLEASKNDVAWQPDATSKHGHEFATVD